MFFGPATQIHGLLEESAAPTEAVQRMTGEKPYFTNNLYVLVGDGGNEVLAVTENFSSNGVPLYADRLIHEGTEVGLILAVPPAQTEAEGKRLWCFGKVLRVEKQLKERKFGVAIGFQRYEELSRI